MLDGIAFRPSSMIGAEKIVTNLYARCVFFVADADQSLRYYTEQLGFSLDWDSKDGVFQVSLFGFELILNKLGAAPERGLAMDESSSASRTIRVNCCASISRTRASRSSVCNGEDQPL
jgi:hypothetical protein